jgi:hypothetical protein
MTPLEKFAQKMQGATPEKIRNEVLRQRGKIEELNKKTSLLQGVCPHEELRYTYGSSTGNYDPHDDCYWVELECPHCFRRWVDDKVKDFHSRILKGRPKAVEVKKT